MKASLKSRFMWLGIACGFLAAAASVALKATGNAEIGNPANPPEISAEQTHDSGTTSPVAAVSCSRTLPSQPTTTEPYPVRATPLTTGEKLERPPSASETMQVLTKERDRLNQSRQKMMARLKVATTEERCQILDQWRETNMAAMKA